MLFINSSSLNKYKLLAEQSGLKQIAVLSSGVLVAQIISFVIQPIVTRLYSVQDFGIFAIINSLIAMVSPILNGQYDLSIVYTESDDEADKITAGALYLGLVLSVIVSLGIIITSVTIPSTFKEAGSWIYVSIPLIFVASITNVMSGYNNRHGKYKLLASVSVYGSGIPNIIKVILGFGKSGVFGLILSQILAAIIGLVMQSRFVILKIRRIIMFDKQTIWAVLVKYKEQPLYSAPALFAVSISYSILPLLINYLYGIKEVGFFSLSVSMLGLPLSLVSANVGKVFLQRASKERSEKGNFINSFKSTTILLAVLSIIPFAILWFISEPLFAFFFGHEWLRSGTFVALLVPMYWVRFVVTSIVSSLIISGKQAIKLVIQCFFIVEALAVYFLTIRLNLPIESFLTLINYSYMVSYLAIFILAYFSSKQFGTKTEGNVSA